MESNDRILRGPPKDWLTVKEANTWLQWPDGFLARLVRLKLVHPPMEFSNKTKKYHWQAVVAIGVLVSLRYITLPAEKEDGESDDDPAE